MQATKKQKLELKLLKKWLAKETNSKLKLAVLLGYSTPETIQRWLEREKISHLKTEEVMRIIKKG